MFRIRKIHHRNSALVPGLHQDVTTRNGNKRAVMGDTILLLGLCGRHLVVAGEMKLVIRDPKNRVGTPYVRIDGAATRSAAASPFVCEYYLLPIVRKRSRVPVGIVRVIYRINALWIHRIFDVQENAIS